MKINKLSDRELIESIQMGDEEAFTVLYERYVKLAHYIAYKLCKNDADCDDIVQDSFVQVRNNIHDIKNPELFKYWLNRIVISKCKNMFRKNKYITYQDDHYEVKNHLMETRTDVLPDALMKLKNDHEVLDALINELPRGQREVVVLHYLQQFSVEETAKLLDLPIGTVKSRLSYARITLKQKIERYEHLKGVKLDFKSMDVLMGTLLAHQMLTSITPSNAKSKFKTKIIEPSIVSSILTKALITSAIGTTLVSSGLALNAWMEESQNGGEQVSVQSLHGEKEEASTFPSITLRDKEITTARIAYYTIKTWAHCEDELQHMTQSELQDVKTLYECLKKDNSQYYQQLEKEGWTEALNKIIENR